MNMKRVTLIGLGTSALIGLPYTLGYNDLPIALPLYTANINTLTLTLPGGKKQDAASAASSRTGAGLSTIPAGLLNYATCQRRLGNVTATHLNPRWSLTSGTR